MLLKLLLLGSLWAGLLVISPVDRAPAPRRATYRSAQSPVTGPLSDSGLFLPGHAGEGRTSGGGFGIVIALGPYGADLVPCYHQSLLGGELDPIPPPRPVTTEADVAAGRVLFKKLCCVKCHTSAAGAEGPHLEGLFGSRVLLADGGTSIADEGYIRESILKPRAKVVRGYKPVMPSYEGQVTGEELRQLVGYLKSLKVAEKN